LWQRIPPAYQQSMCFTDFWEAYKKVIPLKQHRPGGKGAGQTCHIERFNNTLRQRSARLVRQTMSFSKNVKMHKICLALFIYDYNRSRNNNRK
jgi:insertion element IS1 protein InsB